MSRPSDELGRLRWKCRRGLLELDIFFTRFLDRGYADLPERQRVLFERLLEESDPVLYSWLLGHSVPEDKEVADLVQKITQYSHLP